LITRYLRLKTLASSVKTAIVNGWEVPVNVNLNVTETSYGRTYSQPLVKYEARFTQDI